MKLPKWIKRFILSLIDVDENLERAMVENEEILGQLRECKYEKAKMLNDTTYEIDEMKTMLEEDETLIAILKGKIKAKENHYEKLLDQQYERADKSNFIYSKRWVLDQSGLKIPLCICDFIRPSSTLAMKFKNYSLRNIFEYAINYVSDNYQYHGIPDVWQYPEETLVLGKGDCDDSGSFRHSIALSIGRKDIFSCLGFMGDQGHFFNIKVMEDGELIVIENTSNKYLPTPLIGSTYKACYIFNENAIWVVDDSVVFGTAIKDEFNIEVL